MTARDPNANTKQGKRRWRWQRAALCGIAGVIALAPHVYAETRREPNFVPVPPSFRTDEERQEVRIGGHRLCIPANYLTGSHYITKPNADGDRPTVLIAALLPDLEGRTEQNSDEFFLTKGFGRRIQILIRKPQNKTDEFFRIYIRSQMNDRVSEIPENKKINDMLWHRPIGNRYKDDVFTTIESNGDISNIINCSVIGSVPSPVCEHAFVFSELLFKVSYGRNYLPEWQNIKGRAMRLFSAFQDCNSPQPGKGKYHG